MGPRAHEAEPKTPALITDWHSHWIPKSLETDIARVRPFPSAPEFWDVSIRLSHMDATGVDRQVVSFPIPFGLEIHLAPDVVRSIYRRYNEALGELARAHPSRFIGLAAVPTDSPDAAAAELLRASREDGLLGAILPADAFLTPEGVQAFAPLLEAAQSLRSHLYVHPGPVALKLPGNGPIGFLRVDSGDARWLLDAGARLAAAALTLESPRILERYPDVTLHVAMLGGHLPWITPTLTERAAKVATAAEVCPPLKRIYVDTGILSPDAATLGAALRAFGEDRILFGSDFPQFSSRRPVLETVGAGLNPSAREKILRQNSRTLLGGRG